MNLLSTSDPINYATHVDYIVRDNELSILGVDIKGNFHVYTYSPKNLLSGEGVKLVKRVEINYNLGRLIMRKSKSKLSTPVFVSDSNFIVKLDSIDERSYNLLFKVQSYVLNKIDETLGFNPLNFVSNEHHLKPLSVKKPIVKEIVQMFLNMNMKEQIIFLEENDIKYNNLMEFLIKYF